jgi:hypothetical protein
MNDNNEHRTLSNNFTLTSLTCNDFFESEFTKEQIYVGITVFLVGVAIVSGELSLGAELDIANILRAVEFNTNYFPNNVLGDRLNFILDAFSKCRPNRDNENYLLISDATVGKRRSV